MKMAQTLSQPLTKKKKKVQRPISRITPPCASLSEDRNHKIPLDHKNFQQGPITPPLFSLSGISACCTVVEGNMSRQRRYFEKARNYKKYFNLSITPFKAKYTRRLSIQGKSAEGTNLQKWAGPLLDDDGLVFAVALASSLLEAVQVSLQKVRLPTNLSSDAECLRTRNSICPQ